MPEDIVTIIGAARSVARGRTYSEESPIDRIDAIVWLADRNAQLEQDKNRLLDMSNEDFWKLECAEAEIVRLRAVSEYDQAKIDLLTAKVEAERAAILEIVELATCVGVRDYEMGFERAKTKIAQVIRSRPSPSLPAGGKG